MEISSASPRGAAALRLSGGSLAEVGADDFSRAGTDGENEVGAPEARDEGTASAGAARNQERMVPNRDNTRLY